MNVGMKIRRLREYRNLTQDYVAMKLRIGPTAYGNIERNHVKRLTLERLMEIAEVLGVHFSELFTEDADDVQKGMEPKDFEGLMAYFRQDKLLLKELLHSFRDSVVNMDQLMGEHVRLMRTVLEPVRALCNSLGGE